MVSIRLSFKSLIMIAVVIRVLLNLVFAKIARSEECDTIVGSPCQVSSVEATLLPSEIFATCEDMAEESATYSASITPYNKGPSEFDKVSITGAFLQGRPHGLWSISFPLKGTDIEVNVAQGKLNGPTKLVRSDGKKIFTFTGDFENSQSIGQWTYKLEVGSRTEYCQINPRLALSQIDFDCLKRINILSASTTKLRHFPTKPEPSLNSPRESVEQWMNKKQNQSFLDVRQFEQRTKSWNFSSSSKQ